jgi:hypothetical protein
LCTLNALTLNVSTVQIHLLPVRFALAPMTYVTVVMAQHIGRAEAVPIQMKQSKYCCKMIE